MPCLYVYAEQVSMGVPQPWGHRIPAAEVKRFSVRTEADVKWHLFESSQILQSQWTLEMRLK